MVWEPTPNRELGVTLAQLVKAKIPFVRVRSGYGNLPPATIRQFMTTFLGQDSICSLG